MRPLCYDFPSDNRVWEIADVYMFGPDILVAPILHEGERERVVYLPAGTRWLEQGVGQRIEGGHTVSAQAPLERIPVFVREGTSVTGLLSGGE